MWDRGRAAVFGWDAAPAGNPREALAAGRVVGGVAEVVAPVAIVFLGMCLFSSRAV
jgi:hypothetical protein